ncbi:MAG: hypothetical protein R3F11_29480 [Verrucomicrobiales bacterium]
MSLPRHAAAALLPILLAGALGACSTYSTVKQVRPRVLPDWYGRELLVKAFRHDQKKPLAAIGEYLAVARIRSRRSMPIRQMMPRGATTTSRWAGSSKRSARRNSTRGAARCACPRRAAANSRSATGATRARSGTPPSTNLRRRTNSTWAAAM